MNENMGVWEKVRKGFAILRKQGVEAHMNYWCCQSCACSAMDEKRAKKVYFHKQDTGHWMRDSKLPIRYCIFEDVGGGGGVPFEDRVMAHAKNIKKVLESVGCRVEWSGKTDEILEVVG